MDQRPSSIPSWAPAAAAVALVVWAVSIWWMVATLPVSAGDTTTVEEGVSLLSTDISVLAARVDALASEVAALQEERTVLLDRLATVEAAPRVPADDATEDASEGAGDDDLTSHPLFTDGAGRYNCRHFSSFEEAQEALRVNGPGDPNRIDTNKNGVACEDIVFPASVPPPTSTPAAATP